MVFALIMVVIIGTACGEKVISDGGSMVMGSSADMPADSGASDHDVTDLVVPDSSAESDPGGQIDLPVKIVTMQNREFESENVTIERMYHSMVNEKGEQLVCIYFELPKIKGDSDGVRKINAYFQEQYTNWRMGKSDRLSFYEDGMMDDFLASVREHQKIYGKELLIDSGLYYSIRTDLRFEDEKIISFWQWPHLKTDTLSQFGFFGITFDMDTGEPLPFTHFFDVDAIQFKERLRNFLLEHPGIPSDAINEFFDTNTKDFLYKYRGHEWDLSYEYDYDGINVSLALNQIDGYMGIVFDGNANQPFSWPTFG
jgi:hypothetical protein